MSFLKLGKTVGSVLAGKTSKVSDEAKRAVNVDPLDPFGTVKSGTNANTAGLRYTASEKGTVIKDYADSNPSIYTSNKLYSNVKYADDVVTPVSKISDDLTGAGKIIDAGAETVAKTAAAASSPLKTAAKVLGSGVVGAGVGALAISTLLGTAEATTPTPEPEPVIQENPNTEGGNPTYIFNTGNEAVDAGLEWLQTQIDEIVNFLNELMNSLFGTGGEGSGTGTTPYDFGVYTDETGTGTGTTGGISPIKIIVALIIAAVVIGFAVKKFGKKGKKRGNKK